MRRKAAPQSDEDASERDSRLKLILLVVALLLVAGYAATITDISAEIPLQLAAMLGSKLALIAALIVGGAAAGLFLFRRLLRKRGGGKPAETGYAAAGISGRQDFVAMLGRHIDAHAKVGRQVALHLIDIDRFARVNDVMGEAEGDAFLQMVSEKLLVLVNHADRLARIGDDEFAVIQPEAGGARHAEIYARRIEETLKDAAAQLPRHARPGASIGVAVSPDQGADATRLLHNASLALRAAKAAGGETFRVYAREMEMAVAARLQMEGSISEGLHQGWFEVHFQPQYDLRSRRLTGFEALIRMNHPEFGEQMPAAFIPAAEESGLIQPLGEWIIREALGIGIHWPPHLILALNLSLAQFRHGDVAATLLNALSHSKFEASRLQLEISEAVLFEESVAINDQLRRLKSRGVTIVIDDFGLDNSKLRAFSRSACDAVKIDRTLVDRVGEEPEIENLVRSLIGTAQSFDLDVMAEGVERAEQVHFLMSNACDNVQGFLFGRPMHARDLAAVIAKDMRKAIDEEPRAIPSIATA
jgi:diguanylate cyclase (GGDEF)-like protein